MTDLAVRPTTTRRNPGQEVGVGSTSAYLSSPPLPDRNVTLGLAVPEWYRAWLEQALNHLRALPVGWDGDRAEAITDQAVTGIVRCLSAVLNPGDLPPQLVPLIDGGIQADWLVAGASLEIEVSGDGEVFVFGSDVDGTVAIDGGDDEPNLAAAAWRLGRLSAQAATPV